MWDGSLSAPQIESSRIPIWESNHVVEHVYLYAPERRVSGNTVDGNSKYPILESALSGCLLFVNPYDSPEQSLITHCTVDHVESLTKSNLWSKKVITYMSWDLPLELVYRTQHMILPALLDISFHTPPLFVTVSICSATVATAEAKVPRRTNWRRCVACALWLSACRHPPGPAQPAVAPSHGIGGKSSYRGWVVVPLVHIQLNWGVPLRQAPNKETFFHTHLFWRYYYLWISPFAPTSWGTHASLKLVASLRKR